MKVRVLRVLSEDPWKAELIREVDVPPYTDPFEKLNDVLAKYVADGYECDDYGSASIQLCIKKNGERLDKVMIGLYLDDGDNESIVKQLEIDAITALGVLP